MPLTGTTAAPLTNGRVRLAAAGSHRSHGLAIHMSPVGSTDKLCPCDLSVRFTLTLANMILVFATSRGVVTAAANPPAHRRRPDM